MKENIFEDYDIKMHGGNITSVQNYEENILKMRVAMRKQSYLNKPERETGLFSLENRELNPQLNDIVKIAQEQRQDNVMNVIRHNNFSAGYNTGAKFEVLKDESKDRLGMNFETQMNILIASESVSIAS